MKHLILSLALAGGILTAAPTSAQAQFGGGLQSTRLAQRQVINWFQAYLGRLPNR